MFGKSNRYSFKKGIPKKTFTSSFFVLRYGDSQNGFKCSVVVGKKVDKRAVERNRIKRQTVTILKDLLSKDTPLEAVLFARKGAEKLTKEETLDELKNIFTKTKILQ